MMSGERELSGRAGEKKGGSGRQGLWRNERSGGGRKTGGGAGGGLKAELLSMAERSRESKNER